MREEKILIVEDEMIISATIEESLNKIGYNNIEIAFNAQKATELINQNTYDVILMDINLGKGKDGIDVIEEIQKKKDVPVIYVTGNSDNKTLSKAKTTLPGGFIVKPITETDLKVQLELLLYREKLKKIALEENEQIANLYTGDLNGMVMTLNLDGNILYITPHIYKITGKHTYEYINKKLSMVGFEKEFYELIENTLREVKNSAERSFYGNIYSPYIGQRVVNIKTVANGFFSYQFRFYDVTDNLYSNRENEGLINVAVASNNQTILNGFKTITELVKNIRIAAEMKNIASIKDYLKSGKEGVLMLDINLEGLEEFLEEERNNPKIKKVLMASPVIDSKRLKSYNTEHYDGYLSKTANDGTILELFEALALEKNYYDPSLSKHSK
jgi:DNA-binding NarL/FixJ family response regulator